MATRITSEIDSTQTYDFLFEEHNKLDENDVEIETDLHEIDIFGNNHLIAMGAQKQHPNNTELFYYIAYLIYDSKVVSKIGIYETDKRLSSMTHRTMNFALHDLLVDSHYYKNPNALMAFVNKSLEPPVAKLKNKGAGGEEQKQRDEVEEGEIEEESELLNEPKTLESLQSWLKDKIKTIKKPSVSRVFNILRQLKKKESYFDPNIDENYREYLIINPETKGVEITSKFYSIDEDKTLTKSILIMYEYVLNVKFIIINDDDSISNFSILESLNKEKMNEYFQIKSKENLKNLKAFKTFNPLQFVLLKKEGETYKVIRELNMEDEAIVSNDGSLLKKIKEVFIEKPREHLFVDSTSFTTLKEVFEKLESVEPKNESLLSHKIQPRSPNGPPPNRLNVNAGQPHSPNGPPPNRLNVNAGGAAEEVENKETLNSINRLLDQNSHLQHA